MLRLSEPKRQPLSFLTGRETFPGSSPGRAREADPADAPPSVSTAVCSLFAQRLPGSGPSETCR